MFALSGKSKNKVGKVPISKQTHQNDRKLIVLTMENKWQCLTCMLLNFLGRHALIACVSSYKVSFPVRYK